MRSAVASAVLLAAFLAVPAASQEASPVESIAGITGTCQRLVVRGADASASCGPNVLNFAYRTGRSSFGFLSGRQRLVSFSGTEQTRDGDVVRQTLDMITIATGSGDTDPVDTVSLPATGQCEFSNPFRGTPAYIRCTAQTAEGEFAGAFTSNGEAPEVQQF
jgi:hypothetical protein